MEQADIVVSEGPVGVARREELALYLVSVRNIHDIDGKPISGDAMLVRPRGASKHEMLSAVLGCSLEQLPELLTGPGTWSVRELSHIDGHRVRVEPE